MFNVPDALCVGCEPDIRNAFDVADGLFKSPDPGTVADEVRVKVI